MKVKLKPGIIIAFLLLLMYLLFRNYSNQVQTKIVYTQPIWRRHYPSYDYNYRRRRRPRIPSRHQSHEDHHTSHETHEDHHI